MPPMYMASQQHHHDRSSELVLEHVVSSGSFGRIFRARYKATGAIVAVKLTPERPEVYNELIYLAKCNSHFIVGYFGSFVCSSSEYSSGLSKNAESEMWVVTDYCGGGFVSDLIEDEIKNKKNGHHENGPHENGHDENGGSGGRNGGCCSIMPEECIRAVCAGLVLGLEYLHNEGFIHRNIQCNNILLTNAGYIKLTGFQLAAELADIMPKRKDQEKEIITCPRWAAPEVIEDEDYEYKADVWSLGMTAIEMATGNPLDICPDIEAKARTELVTPSDTAPTLQSHPDDWNPQLVDFIVDQCCREDPSERSDAHSLATHPFVKKEVWRGRNNSPLFPWHLMDKQGWKNDVDEP